MHWAYLAVFAIMAIPALAIAVIWFFRRQLTAVSWLIVAVLFIASLTASNRIADVMIGLEEFNQNTGDISVLFQIAFVTAVMAFVARKRR
jgi:hypothetical protein